MSEYAFNRVFRQSVGCPISKYVLYLLAYCPQFSLESLIRDSELTPEQIESALDYLLEKKFIEFRKGHIKGKDGLEFQIKILF